MQKAPLGRALEGGLKTNPADLLCLLGHPVPSCARAIADNDVADDASPDDEPENLRAKRHMEGNGQYESPGSLVKRDDRGGPEVM